MASAATEEQVVYLTAREVAERLQVSEDTVKRLANEGKLPSVRLGHRLLRFEARAIEEVLRKLPAHGPEK